jgi:hypothetical protein
MIARQNSPYELCMVVEFIREPRARLIDSSRSER